MKNRFLICIAILLLIMLCTVSCDDQINGGDDMSDSEQTEDTHDSDADTSTEDEKESQEHEHIFGEWRSVVIASCDAEGIVQRECEGCGEIEKRILPMLSHTLTNEVFAPDCEHEGYTLYKCNCGYEYRSEYIIPLGHDLDSKISHPTCLTEGYTEYSCKRCEYSFKSDYTLPLGHDLKGNTTPPTCDKEGYTDYACLSCDYAFRGDYIAPLGHSFKEEITRPTILAAGYTRYTCECSYTYADNYIFYSDILENAYVNNSDVLAKGIDVSRWNHELNLKNEYIPLDWAAIKASGVDFVILKAGSTKSGIEPTFEMDYEGARAAGLEIGIYYYTYATTVEEIKKDAEDLLTWIVGKQFEYPIYLDLEDPSLEGLGKNLLSDMCEAFISALQAEGYYAGLYANHNWLTYILDSQQMLSIYDIWYARYPLTEEPVWDEEKYGKQLGMWQYSESGTIEGFDCAFDLNYAYKNYKEIMEKWHLNGF